MSVLGTAVVLVGVLGAFNMIITLALIRRMKAAPAVGARDGFYLPPVGTEIPHFHAVSTTGRELSLEDISRGGALVAFLSVGCVPCQRIMERMVASPPEGETFVFIDAGLAEDGTIAADASDMIASLAEFSEVVAVERGWAMHSPFGIGAFPTLLRLERGRVAASGLKLTDVIDKSARREPVGAA